MLRRRGKQKKRGKKATPFFFSFLFFSSSTAFSLACAPGSRRSQLPQLASACAQRSLYMDATRRPWCGKRQRRPRDGRRGSKATAATSKTSKTTTTTMLLFVALFFFVLVSSLGLPADAVQGTQILAAMTLMVSLHVHCGIGERRVVAIEAPGNEMMQQTETFRPPSRPLPPLTQLPLSPLFLSLSPSLPLSSSQNSSAARASRTPTTLSR